MALSSGMQRESVCSRNGFMTVQVDPVSAVASLI